MLPRGGSIGQCQKRRQSLTVFPTLLTSTGVAVVVGEMTPPQHQAPQLAPDPIDGAGSPWPASIGLALIIAGQPLGWAIRGQTGGGKSILFPVGIVIIGFLLLLRSDMLVRLQLHARPVPFAATLLLLLIPVTALLLIDPVGLVQYFVYMIFIVGVIFAIGFNPSERFDRLPEALMLVAGASSLAPLLELAIGGVAKGFFRLAISGNDNTLVVATTGGIAMLAATVSAFSPRRGSILWGFICAGVWLAGLAATLLSGTRSVLGMILVLLPLYAFILRWRQAPGTARGAKTLAFWLVLAAGAVAAPTAAIAVLGIDTLTEISGRSIMRVAGALALFDGSAGGVDESTAIRGRLAAESWANMTVVGNGVMALPYSHGNLFDYQHNAYLQAFYDLGLFGGFFYVCITLLIPLAMVAAALVRGDLTPTEQLLILLFVFVQGDMLAHSTPYNWTPLLAVGLVYVLLARDPSPGRRWRYDDQRAARTGGSPLATGVTVA